MPDRIDFLRMINEHPTDVEPQRVFADWLEDQGNPEAKIWRGEAEFIGGLVGRGGLGGLVGLGGLGGLFHPRAPIMLIEGENALVFMPHGYGFSVLLGFVAKELVHGWILDPCREVLDTHNGDCWAELAAGKKSLRTACEFGPLIKDGFRVPHGCGSMKWQGELPEIK